MNVTVFSRRALDGILLLDKPAGISSNAALQRAKYLYRARKAGHTGSLDPLATGLLPICFGQATKLCGLLLDADKRYLVRATLGEQTDTGDAEGQVVARSDATRLARRDLEAVLPRFTGEIFQRPPMYSALKKDGKRLYELARRGETVERAPRRLVIHELRLVSFGNGSFELDVCCSKGTYIRCLVEDIAEAAGQHAHVGALRRLQSGPFGPQGMYSLDALEAAAAAGPEALDRLLLPVLDGLAGWRKLDVGVEDARRLGHGQAVEAPGGADPGRVAVIGSRGELLGLAEVTPSGALQPRTWLAAPGGQGGQ